MMQTPEFQLRLPPTEDATRKVNRATTLDKVERAIQTESRSSPSHKTSPLGASKIRPGVGDNGGGSERLTTVRQGRPITPDKSPQNHGQKEHAQTESPKRKGRDLPHAHSRPATPTRTDAKYQLYDREEAMSTWCRTKAGGCTRYFIEKVDYRPEGKIIYPRKASSSSPGRTPNAVVEKQRTRRIEREDRRSASVDSPRRRPRPENKYVDIPHVRDMPDTTMPHVFGTPRHLRSPLSRICMDIRTNKALPTPPESDSPCELPMPNVFRRDSVNTNDPLYDEGSWYLGPTDVRFGDATPEMAMRMAQVCQSTPILIPISMRASIHGEPH